MKLDETNEEVEFESELYEDDYEGDVWDDEIGDDSHEDDVVDEPAWKKYLVYGGIFLVVVLLIVFLKTLMGPPASKQTEDPVDVPGSEQIITTTTVESTVESSVEEDEETTTTEEEAKVYDHQVPDEKIKADNSVPAFTAAERLMDHAAETPANDRALVYDGLMTQFEEIERGLREGGTVTLKFDDKSAVDRLAMLMRDGYRLVGETFVTYEGENEDTIRFVGVFSKPEDDQNLVAFTGVYDKAADQYAIKSIVSSQASANDQESVR